jgi:hypothetical protein
MGSWCQRVADPLGVYRRALELAPGTISTDGLCPACSALALARIKGPT